MVLKYTKHVIKELVESLEQAHAIKNVMNDIEPPKPFTLFDMDRISSDKDRRRGFPKRSAERLFDRDQRVRFLWKAELNCMPKIDLSDRPVHVKEGIGCIEKHNSDR
jgi:hypothetical protein